MESCPLNFSFSCHQSFGFWTNGAVKNYPSNEKPCQIRQSKVRYAKRSCRPDWQNLNAPRIFQFLQGHKSIIIYADGVSNFQICVQ